MRYRYQPLYKMPLFAAYSSSCPNAEELSPRFLRFLHMRDYPKRIWICSYRRLMKFHMYKQFTVSVIVFKELKQDAQVLMIHHRKFDRWMIPGGHVESSENPAEAAVREVLEETGINAHLISFLHKPLLVKDAEWLPAPEYLYQQLIPASKKEGPHYHIDMTYVAVADSGELKINKEETKNVSWFPIDEVLGVNTFDGTKVTIMDTYKKLIDNNLYHEFK